MSPTECQRKTQTRKRNQRTLRTRPIVLCNVYRLAIPNGDGNHRSWPKCFARPCPSTLVAPTVATTAATYNLGRVSAFRSTWRQSSWFPPTPRYEHDRDEYQRTRIRRYLRSVGTRSHSIHSYMTTTPPDVTISFVNCELAFYHHCWNNQSMYFLRVFTLFLRQI